MADIGARLREARMRAKIDINEVEVRTKIRAKYLRAMENDEWDLLPGEVYARSFLRTYGEFLGLDTRQLIDDFKRMYERPSDHEARPITPRSQQQRDRGPRGPLVPAWALIGAVLVAVVAALYFIGIGTKGKSPTTPTNTVVTNTHHSTHKPTHKHRPPTQVKLELVPTGPVYVCVEDGSGRALIKGLTYNTGQTIPVQRAQKLLITLGNNAVQMKVNGVSIPVAASSSAIGYELLPTSHRLLPAAQQPRCGG
jgi:cytoskeleton protein RodZ